MNARLRKIWSEYPPAARAAWLIFLSVSAVIIYAMLLHSIEDSRVRLKARIGELRTQSADMDRQAAEISRLRATAGKSIPAGADLPQTIQTIVESHGLSMAVARISGRDTENADLTLSNVSFAQWLAFARSMQAQQIRVENCKIEGVPGSGMVNITASLNRPLPR